MKGAPLTSAELLAHMTTARAWYVLEAKALEARAADLLEDADRATEEAARISRRMADLVQELRR